MSRFEVNYGINPTDILDVYHDGTFEELSSREDKVETITHGYVTDWTFIVIRTVNRKKRKQRLFLVRPGTERVDISYFGFFAQGQGEQVLTVNNARRVGTLWENRDTTDWTQPDAL